MPAPHAARASSLSRKDGSSSASETLPARILLVDDREANLDALETILKDERFELVRARSAQEALGRLLNEEFALVLLDVRMPDMDGFEAAALIRQRKRSRDLPIIFVTAFEGSREDVERAYELGAIDFISKPVSGPILRSKVKAYVDLYRSKHDLERLVEERTAELRRTAEASAFMAAVVRSSNDAVVTKTLDGIITSWNAAAEQLFGYTSAEAVGKPVLILIPEERRAEEQEILSKIRQDEQVEHYETLRRRKDGSLVPVSLTISPVRNLAGQIVGASKIVRDITEQKRIEDAIKLLNADLEGRVLARTAALQVMIRELDTFAYTVAHDLRAPLRTIHSLSEIVLEESSALLPETSRRHLARICQAGSRMDRLIRDLLAYSRITREDVVLKPVDLDRHLREVEQSLGEELRRADPILSVDGRLGSVVGSESGIHQVLSNLIANAIKFVARGVRPAVRLRTEAMPGSIRLWVEDNGIGIAPEHHAKLFKVFERLNVSDEYPGTGIGLSIVKRAVERMQGRLGVESDLGSGSRFWVELPSIDAARPSEEPAP